MNFQAVFFVLIIGALVYQFWPRKEAWTGIVYPDAPDLSVFVVVGDFESLESCRDAIFDRISRMSNPSNVDYECGLNCTPYDPEIDLFICEETSE